MTSEVFNEDCMIGMARYPDKWFDLAVVDPPYGIRQDGHRENNRSKLAKSKNYHKALWDQPKPNEDYFNELFRVSVNQIIWGANHFISRMPFDSSSWIVWDKDNSGHFADCELAWSSFDTAVRRFKFTWNGMLQGDMKNKESRIHPTQKPIALYSWIFDRYATKGMKILDTHLGSQSSRIAADKAGMNFTGFELDKDYFDAGCKRYDQYKQQLTLQF